MFFNQHNILILSLSPFTPPDIRQNKNQQINPIHWFSCEKFIGLENVFIGFYMLDGN